MEPNDKRLVRVTISATLLVQALTTGNTTQHVLVRRGLPAGAVLVRAAVNEMGDLDMLFAHASFAVVPMGATVPSLDIGLESNWRLSR